MSASGLDAGERRRYLQAMQDWLRGRIGDLAAAGLLRDPADAQTRERLYGSGRAILDACSNDYLGHGRRSVSRETFEQLGGAPIGAGAARLVQGAFVEQAELEQALATWTGTESSLLTSSAFAANTGSIPALCDSDTLVVSDALNHASIIDGCRLARCRVAVIPHLDLEALERTLRDRPPRCRALVALEAVFSMDGDSPDLPAVRALCDRHGAALLLDEAHSLGVLGPSGAGLAAAAQVTPDVLVGGLGKAVGAQGGFVAGTHELRTWLWNRARTFVFSTAPSPAFCRLILQQVRRARADDAGRERLRRLAAELRSALLERGVPVATGGTGPIVPVILGSSERAMQAMMALREHGILAQAIRPPTVPVGAARLRLTIHADWPDGAIDRITSALEVACVS